MSTRAIRKIRLDNKSIGYLIIMMIFVSLLACDKNTPLDSEFEIKKTAKIRLSDYCKKENINFNSFKVEKIEKQPEHNGFGERWHVSFISIEKKEKNTFFRTFSFFKYRNKYEESSHGVSIMSK
jgi:hypothetical protein